MEKPNSIQLAKLFRNELACGPYLIVQQVANSFIKTRQTLGGFGLHKRQTPAALSERYITNFVQMHH